MQQKFKPFRLIKALVVRTTFNICHFYSGIFFQNNFWNSILRSSSLVDLYPPYTAVHVELLTRNDMALARSLVVEVFFKWGQCLMKVWKLKQPMETCMSSGESTRTSENGTSRINDGLCVHEKIELYQQECATDSFEGKAFTGQTCFHCTCLCY